MILCPGWFYDYSDPHSPVSIVEVKRSSQTLIGREGLIKTEQEYHQVWKLNFVVLVRVQEFEHLFPIPANLGVLLVNAASLQELLEGQTPVL